MTPEQRDALTPRMRAALAALPFELTPHGFLPVGAPHGGTLQALERRGLAECDGRRWLRTHIGEFVWENRP